jgi:IclR family KDG regulon transcriptional repressor
MIQSVQRTFAILEYIAANGNLVRLNDIAQALSLQNTTVHNFLTSLKELGYVEQDELTPRYRLTSKVMQLDYSEVSVPRLRADLRPVLEKLTAELGETSFMAVQLGSYFRHEWKCEPNRSIRISLELGREYEMQHTAIGKVFMAYSPHLAQVIWRNITQEEAARQASELAEVVKNGYALDLEEYEKELNCVAVPYVRKNRIIAVVGLSGPAFRFDVRHMQEAAERIKKLLSQAF